MSLCRALSKFGVLSRTQAAVAIAAGRVTVGGQVVTDPEFRIHPAQAVLALDGVPVRRAALRTFALHKPLGLVTTRADELRRATVYDLLPTGMPFVSPIGRLDRDSSGLLLFTNDTDLGNAVSGPSARLAKVYAVEFDGPLTDRDVGRMINGMAIDGEPLLPVEVAFADPSDRTRALLTLREGKNRQIRRMATACGREVVRLHRLAIGPVQLGDQPVATVRELSAAELQALRAATRA